LLGVQKSKYLLFNKGHIMKELTVVIDLIAKIIGLIAALTAAYYAYTVYGLQISTEITINGIENKIQRMPNEIVNLSSKTKVQTFIGNDTVPITTPDLLKQLNSMLQGKRAKGAIPDGPEHVLTFFQEPDFATGKLYASTVKEAWVMAYIEKNMGQFNYKGIPIYQYGDRNAKRDAIIKLVKEKGAKQLFDMAVSH
jgi:hypothetical protein